MSHSSLFILFALTAMVYAMAGFGGGSTYSALLALSGTDHTVIPMVALVCNLVVVTGGVIQYLRVGCLKFPMVAPFALASVPFAFLGGTLDLSEQAFRLILGIMLVFSGLIMLRPGNSRNRVHQPDNRVAWPVALPIGAVLGLLAGITGIGGGIFLGPLLHLSGWAESRVIAATTSAFILVNSLAGLAGHLGKWELSAFDSNLGPLIWLPLAVLAGGQVGSILGVGRYGDRFIRWITTFLVFYVGTRLLISVSGFPA